MNPLNRIALALLVVYKRLLSPALHSLGVGGCGYQPTCSEYAQIAFSTLPPHQALFLTIWRVLRCNPFHRGGYDPVPAPFTMNKKPAGTTAALSTPNRK